MTPLTLMTPIALPIIAGIILLAFTDKFRRVRDMLVLGTAVGTFAVAAASFNHTGIVTLPWATSLGLSFSLRLYHFSSFIVAAASAFGVVIALYATAFMRGKSWLNQFYGYFFITLGCTNGAVLADNLLLLLFFWEGLLVTLFGMIAIGTPNAYRTATKAFVIVGVSDLCMMIGIALTGYVAGTLTISQITLPLSGLGGVAFVLLMIGAISKAGSMPFHTWIPDAAIDAPLPFMALVPAALEKLLGIYFLARITLDLFTMAANTWASMLLMVIGVITILFAVMMALIQKDYKRLLSYHAISQVGYMILGIGTAVPAGIVGGLFHMINHAMYKSCLFLTGGSVEKQAGTTSLESLGGLGKMMPITFGCFIVAAAAISGVPPFNGFFSKELVYDGALERGAIFYAGALAGSFLTAASFLKLGHAAFLGKRTAQQAAVKEAPLAMLVPMIIIAALCILFGVCNFLPLQYLIQPILGPHALAGHDFSGMPTNMLLIILTVVVLVLAVANHLFGFRTKGSALKATDHIRYAPILSGIYDRAVNGVFDPYNWLTGIATTFARVAFWCDRAINAVYDVIVVRAAAFVGHQLRRAHTGNFSAYVSWSLIALAVIAAMCMLQR